MQGFDLVFPDNNQIYCWDSKMNEFFLMLQRHSKFAATACRVPAQGVLWAQHAVHVGSWNLRREA
jgi:hypothetical protein